MIRPFAVTLAALALAVAPPLSAQDAPLAGPRVPAAWASSEPALDLVAGDETPARATGNLTLATAAAVRRRAPGTVLMIVGGAVAVAGLVADESLLVLGGVAVGAYGLFLYLS